MFLHWRRMHYMRHIYTSRISNGALAPTIEQHITNAVRRITNTIRGNNNQWFYYEDMPITSRYRPGTVALRGLRKFRKTTSRAYIERKMDLQRRVRETMRDMKIELPFTNVALVEAIVDYIQKDSIFDADLAEDIELARIIRGDREFL